MSDTPTETIERRRRDAYRVENTVSCLRGGRAVAWVWFAITPPFLIVDFSRFPEQAQTLMWMRLFSLFIPLGMLAVLAIPLGKRRPKETVLGFTAIGAANTLVMMACTGGHASPYSAGIGLAMLLAALLMPWPSSWTWLTCSVLIAEYLVAGPILAFEGGDRMIANNLFSYVATAMIAGFATVSRERLRWREFLARDALQDSESRLKDEAEISQALAIAGREMIELLDAPRILHRLCRLTTQLLRCEVSHTILWDRERDLWRGVAEYGDTQEQ